SLGTGPMSWAACGYSVRRALLAGGDAAMDTCRTAQPARARSPPARSMPSPAPLRRPTARLAFASGIQHGRGQRGHRPPLEAGSLQLTEHDAVAASGAMTAARPAETSPTAHAGSSAYRDDCTHGRVAQWHPATHPLGKVPCKPFAPPKWRA